MSWKNIPKAADLLYYIYSLNSYNFLLLDNYFMQCVCVTLACILYMAYILFRINNLYGIYYFNLNV